MQVGQGEMGCELDGKEMMWDEDGDGDWNGNGDRDWNGNGDGDGNSDGDENGNRCV